MGFPGGSVVKNPPANAGDMGSIKDRNGIDLTEADAIKKRWQEYTELYKKIFMTHIIMMV